MTLCYSDSSTPCMRPVCVDSERWSDDEPEERRAVMDGSTLALVVLPARRPMIAIASGCVVGSA